MALYKNKASQKIPIFAWDTANSTEKTGDAANITAQISKDGGATAATDDTSPTELDATDAPGVYLFDMLQAETNADMLVLSSSSSTTDIKIEPMFIYTDTDLSNSLFMQTTIATYATQTSFTLTAGSVDDNAYKHCAVMVTDGTTDVQKQMGYVQTYTGATKTITLYADPGRFTMEAGDYVTIFPISVVNSSSIPPSTIGATHLQSDAITADKVAADVFAETLTTQMTEAYAADGTAPTLAQALCLIQQSLHEFAISSTTRTVKKLDGSTTAATFTLDDATNPTSTTRAT